MSNLLRRIRKLETRLTDISEPFEVRVISAADGQIIDRIACDAARLAYEEHCAKHGCETKGWRKNNYSLRVGHQSLASAWRAAALEDLIPYKSRNHYDWGTCWLAPLRT